MSATPYQEHGPNWTEDTPKLTGEGSSASACSPIPVICTTCHHWEPKGDPTLANGYCPIFHKTTNENDGKRCTAWEKIHLENAQAQAPADDNT